MNNMRKTSCKARMKFIDVTALEDASCKTEDNQMIGDMRRLSKEIEQNPYGTFELNQFILDGNKKIISDNTEDIVFWSNQLSDEECYFKSKPKITISFTQQHSSAGVTLYFADEYPEEIIVTWYTLAGSQLDKKTFYPEGLIYTCINQVSNYGKIEIEVIKSRLPERYVKLRYILYGRYIEWDESVIKSAKIHEEIDEISSTLSINTASISIVDTKNDFDIGNDNGAWKCVQRTQEVTLTELINDIEIPAGTFFIDTTDFKSNIASFKLSDRIGLMDNYTYYDGKIYENELVGTLLEDIFACAAVTKYTIQEEVYNMRLSGYLAVQSCRAALQMVCFACAAVADDSRSDTIRVFLPDRYVSATIATDRKFNEKSKVELDEYVSGITIECGRYVAEMDLSEVFNDILPKGRSRITFSSPCMPETLNVSVGKIIEKKTNYIIVEMSEAGLCVINGKKYEQKLFSYTKNVDHIEAGELENVKKFGTITLFDMELLQEVAKNILSYFALRKIMSMKYISNNEKVGNWVNIADKNANMATTLIEQQDIDLAGGFIANATCRGYSIVVTEYIFAGTELYAGGDVLI